MSLRIQNGRLIDPSQRIDSVQNILIADGKVRWIGLGTPEADQIIDAGGKVVCPGFLDMHAHEDPCDPAQPPDERRDNLACLLRMGVTTALAGNCGDNFGDPVAFLERAEKQGCYVNVAMLAGYTFYREQFSAAGPYRPAAAAETEKIRAALAAALEHGCCGISFGLEYVPGTSAEEIAMAAELCAGRKKLLAAHIRGCAEAACAAAQEVLEAGRIASVPVQLSHIGSMAAYGQMAQLLQLVDAYRAAGVDASCDCYPYTAFCTYIGSAPYDDLDAMHCRYEDIELCEGRYKGQRCTKEIFEQERREHPDYLTVGHVMLEEEIRMAYRHPHVMVGSDCFLSRGEGHPRAAGAFPRFLSRYTGDGTLSLYEAIERITARPAEKLGLSGKGTLRVGADADLVIFDPARFRDRASFSEPTLPPEGLDLVLLGGETAVRGGTIVNARLGRPIR